MSYMEDKICKYIISVWRNHKYSKLLVLKNSNSIQNHKIFLRFSSVFSLHKTFLISKRSKKLTYNTSSININKTGKRKEKRLLCNILS